MYRLSLFHGPIHHPSPITHHPLPRHCHHRTMNTRQQDQGFTTANSSSSNNNSSTNNANENNSTQPPSPTVEEKIQAALATLRRQRDNGYRAMVEAQEIERNSQEELMALETMVQDLKEQNTHLTEEMASVRAQMGLLESQVQQLTEQANLQHQELVAARASIEQQQLQMEATALKRAALLKTMHQLAHDRTLKLTNLKQVNEQDDGRQQQDQQTEALERELNSTVLDWAVLPQLIQDQAQLYLNRAKDIATRNEELKLELRQKGIDLEEGSITFTTITAPTASTAM